MMNQDNWNYSSYISNDLKVFIALSAQPSNNSEELFYSVTSLQSDEVEVFQQDFNQLEDAIAFANKRYGHWDFVDPLEGKSSGEGCGSCAAH